MEIFKGFGHNSQQILQMNALPFAQIYIFLLQVYQHGDVFNDTVSVTKKCGLLKPRVKNSQIGTVTPST
jgi:hypothetical protein